MKEDQSAFEEIYDAVDRMGVCSLSQLENATQFTRSELSTRLSKYVRKGKLFRISKDRYATEPQAKISGYTEQRQRLEKQRDASAFAAQFFNKMVKPE